MSTLRTPAAWRVILAEVPPGPAADNPTRAQIERTEERFITTLLAHGVDPFQARLALGGRPARLARWDGTESRELDGLAYDVAWMALPTKVRRYLVQADRAVRDDETEAWLWEERDALMSTEDDPGVDPVPRWTAEELVDAGLRSVDEPRYVRKTTDRQAERPAPDAAGWFPKRGARR